METINKISKSDVMSLTKPVQSLFAFIDFLYSKTEYFLEKRQLVEGVLNLGNRRNSLKPNKNYKDRIEYNKVQAEIEQSFEIAKAQTTDVIVSKIKELVIADISTPILNLNASADLFKLQKEFNESDLGIIKDAKIKYLEFRTKTDCHFFLQMFFSDLDRDLKEFFDFFEDPEPIEFEALEARSIDISGDNDTFKAAARIVPPLEQSKHYNFEGLLKELYRRRTNDFIEILKDTKNFHSINDKRLLDDNENWIGTKQLIVTFYEALKNAKVLELNEETGMPKIKKTDAIKILCERFNIPEVKKSDGGTNHDIYLEVLTPLINKIKDR